MAALEIAGIQEAVSLPDFRRTEFGATELIISGIARWNDKPALTGVERLSHSKTTCVLSDALAESIGPSHNWEEAWSGKRLLVTGALHFGMDGYLKRIDADEVEDLPWTSVTLADLRDIDVLEGRSVKEHMALLREGGEDG